MLAFFIVFLASNAINVLILLSPFAVIDAALKGFRLLVLLTVTATAFRESVAGRGLGPVHHRLRLPHRRLVLPPVALRVGLHLGLRHAATQTLPARQTGEPDVPRSPNQQGPRPHLRQAAARRQRAAWS